MPYILDYLILFINSLNKMRKRTARTWTLDRISIISILHIVLHTEDCQNDFWKMLSPEGGQIWLTGRSFIWPPLRQNRATWTTFDDDDKDGDDDEVEEDSVINRKREYWSSNVKWNGLIDIDALQLAKLPKRVRVRAPCPLITKIWFRNFVKIKVRH